MNRIVGLDLSLTATGVACPDHADTLDTSKARGMERLQRIADWLFDDHHLASADLVVVEGYSYGSAHSHAHSLGELGGVVRHRLWRAGVPYVDVPPASLKKFATGNGGAGKDKMVATAARAGCAADDNNAVDAWWLRQLGCYGHGGGDVARTTYRDAVVDGIDWAAVWFAGDAA